MNNFCLANFSVKLHLGRPYVVTLVYGVNLRKLHYVGFRQETYSNQLHYNFTMKLEHVNYF